MLLKGNRRYRWISSEWQKGEQVQLTEGVVDESFMLLKQSIYAFERTQNRIETDAAKTFRNWFLIGSNVGELDTKNSEDVLTYTTIMRILDASSALKNGIAEQPEDTVESGRVSRFNIAANPQWEKFYQPFQDIRALILRAVKSSSNLWDPQANPSNVSNGSMEMFKQCLREVESLKGFTNLFRNMLVAETGVLPYFLGGDTDPLELGQLNSDIAPRRPLWFAAMASPIFLLSASNILKWQFKRHDLLMFANDLPKHKLLVIIQVECMVWDALFQMATGKDHPRSCVLQLLSKLEPIKSNKIDMGTVKSWFDTRPYYKPSPATPPHTPATALKSKRNPPPVGSMFEDTALTGIDDEPLFSPGQSNRATPENIGGTETPLFLPTLSETTPSSSAKSSPSVQVDNVQPHEGTEMGGHGDGEAQDSPDPGTESPVFEEEAASENQESNNEGKVGKGKTVVDRNKSQTDDTQGNGEDAIQSQSQQDLGDDEEDGRNMDASEQTNSQQASPPKKKRKQTGHGWSRGGSGRTGRGGGKATPAAGNGIAKGIDATIHSGQSMQSEEPDEETDISSTSEGSDKSAEATRASIEIASAYEEAHGTSKRKSEEMKMILRLVDLFDSRSIALIHGAVVPYHDAGSKLVRVKPRYNPSRLKAHPPLALEAPRKMATYTSYSIKFAGIQASAVVRLARNSDDQESTFKAWASESSRAPLAGYFKSIEDDATSTLTSLCLKNLPSYHLILHGAASNAEFAEAVALIHDDLHALVIVQDYLGLPAGYFGPVIRLGSMDLIIKAASSSPRPILQAVGLPVIGHKGLLSIFSDHRAWHLTRTSFITRPDEPFPAHECAVGMVSLAGSFSPNRITANGRATRVHVFSGVQIWFLCIPQDESRLTYARQCIRSPHPPTSNKYSICAFKVEPGRGLLIKPGTYYSNWTLEDAVVEITHGYLTSTLHLTIAAQVHQLAFPKAALDEYSPVPKAMIQRLMLFYYNGLIYNKVSKRDSIHLPDLTLGGGALSLLSAIALGLTLILFDPMTYKSLFVDLGPHFLADNLPGLTLEELDEYAYIRGLSMDLLARVMNTHEFYYHGVPKKRQEIYTFIGDWLARVFLFCQHWQKDKSQLWVNLDKFLSFVQDLFPDQPTCVISKQFGSSVKSGVHNSGDLMLTPFGDATAWRFVPSREDEEILEAGRSTKEKQLVSLVLAERPQKRRKEEKDR
ncbi:hypothetical protein BJ165DRAFT_1410396 [Panaeolus papilionaceus]|nr:hypothetical protein BJ165DRAFT_1410396 [Panaeolus papilionaceus]